MSRLHTRASRPAVGLMGWGSWFVVVFECAALAACRGLRGLALSRWTVFFRWKINLPQGNAGLNPRLLATSPNPIQIATWNILTPVCSLHRGNHNDTVSKLIRPVVVDVWRPTTRRLRLRPLEQCRTCSSKATASHEGYPTHSHGTNCNPGDTRKPLYILINSSRPSLLCMPFRHLLWNPLCK